MVPFNFQPELGKAAPPIIVPLADAPITTRSVHEQTTAGSREDRRFHQQLSILLSCGIRWVPMYNGKWAAWVCLAWFRYLEKEPRSRTEPTPDMGKGGGGVGSDWYGKGAHTHTHTHTRRFSSGTTGSVTGSYSKPNEPSQYSIFPCKILLNITPSTSPHTPQTSGWYFL